jgi:hypothetical protein
VNGALPTGNGTWIDAASRVIVQVGFPVVVSAVLLWFLLTKFQDSLEAITLRMEKNATVVEAFTGELHLHTEELKAQTHYLGKLTELAEKRDREK